VRTNVHPFSPEAIASRAKFAGMVMEATGSANVIDPEVWGDMAQAEFTGAVRVLTSGAVVYDNTLEGEPGSTVEFGSWDALTDLVDLAETDVLVPEALGTSSHNVTIKEAGKAVSIKDRARLVSLGDPETEARRQFGVLAARKVDGDLITAALADNGANGGAPLTVDTAEDATFSWDVLVDAIATFGDEWDPQLFAGLFIRSNHMADALRDPQFIEAAKLGNLNQSVTTGTIGQLAGLPVFVTDRLPGPAAGTNGSAALIKRNALGALYKRRPLVESDRDILARETVVTTNLHYAVKRMKSSGVCVVNFTNAVA
jgi:N4-gp56 family major capsid protein